MKEIISKKQLKEFSFVFGLGLPIVIGIIIPLISGHDLRTWTFWVGFITLIIGSLKPRFLLYPYKVWMWLGHVLGWLNSRIILGLVFLIVLQPIALIMKINGYDPLKKKKSNLLMDYINLQLMKMFFIKFKIF